MAIHDMKSSLVLIGGFLQRLFSGHEATPESRRKYLEIIKKEQCKLEALLNDIEVCPEITGRLRLECRPIAVDRELTDLCEAYQLKAARKRTSLNLSKPSLPVLVLADSRRLHRAFANLLDNSFKFSATGSAIRVAIQQAGNEVSISFADDGPGIDPRDLPYLFNAHYRGRAGHRTEGSGLGLAAVKVIVEAHGGRVLAENRPGGGALFTVILPTGNSLHTDQAEGFRPSLQQNPAEKPLLRVVNARP
jgi:signal transduction histidine kinase